MKALHINGNDLALHAVREVAVDRRPVLLDPDLQVGRQYDMLPKLGQTMGGMMGVAQMGFVVIRILGRELVASPESVLVRVASALALRGAA